MGNTMAPTRVEQLGSVFTQTPVSARPPTYCRALGPLPFLFLSKKKKNGCDDTDCERRQKHLVDPETQWQPPKLRAVTIA